MSNGVLKIKNTSELLRFIDENDIQYVDFNFTDSLGKLQHTTQHVNAFSKDIAENGVMIDGSSIAGWKGIEESDIQIRPDLGKVCLDPFAAQPTLKIFCDVIDVESGKPYHKCPRSIAKAAEAYLKSTGYADTVYFGPEVEFFVFDDVRFRVEANEVSCSVDSRELPANSGTVYAEGNMGHRPKIKGGYFPDAPVDSMSDLRSEMLTVMASMGVPVEKHHHEVAASQCELGILFSTLVDCADNVQLYKHAVHNVANIYGKTATFMPKPVYGDNGSGMHAHQSLWNGNKPLFAGDRYAGLSETALYYIGGIVKHAKALNAFTNPSTNSYKRLVPGFEAPVLLSYSYRNRSAACRIPHTTSEAGKRVEVRFPDPTANPYLAFAAMLMAGLDGIENRILPGDPMDENLYSMEEEKKSVIPTVCGSLSEAIEALKADSEFLMKGDVFTEDTINSYMELKMKEIEALKMTPHPVEFQMYYSS